MSSVTGSAFAPPILIPPSQTAPGAQSRVDAAMSRIAGIQSAIAGLTSDLASIQQIIAQLQAELGSLERPDPGQFYKTERRTEGTPPRTVTVRVFDSAAFNAAMSTYLGKVAALEQKIQAAQNQLAQKESELARKQGELGQAQSDLASAQRDLEKALANDRKALEEAQRRYREQQEKVQQQQQAALKAQAAAQKAQDDLQKAQEQLRQMQESAKKLGTYDEDKHPPFQVDAKVSDERLAKFAEETRASGQAAREALRSAANDLPSVRNGQLLPPVNQISARDYLELAPHLASFETGAYDAGLLAGFDPANNTGITPQMTAQMIDAWTTAGFSAADIKLALSSLGAPPPALFTTDAPNIPAGTVPNDGPNATPAEMAAWMLEYDQRLSGDSSAELPENSFFVGALAAHANDPVWISQFYGALGADLGAQLLSDSVKPENYENLNKEVIDRQVATVRDSLVALQQQGFNQGDMDALMKHWANDRDDLAFRGLAFGGDHFNAGLSQLFAGLPAGTDPIKNAFFDSATKLALDPDSGVDPKIMNDLAAAAAFVLAGSSTSNQAMRLNELNETDTLRSFTERALSAEASFPTIDALAADAHDATGAPRFETSVWNDGIAGLLLNMGVADVRDGRDPGPPVSDDDIRAIRDTIFEEAVKIYGDDRGRLREGDQRLLDAMAFTYANDGKALMAAMMSTNHGAIVDSAQEEGLRGFFEAALFSQPGSVYDGMVLSTLESQSKELAADLVSPEDPKAPGLSDADFEAKYGMPRSYGHSQLGLTLGLVAAGLQAALKERKADAEATANALDFVINIATSLIPGPADETVGALLKAIYDESKSTVIDGLKTKGLDAVKEELAKNAELDADKALRALYRAVRGAVEDTGNFHAGFEYGLGTDWPDVP